MTQKTWTYDPQNHVGGEVHFVKLKRGRFGSWPLVFGKAFDIWKIRIIWNIDKVRYAQGLQLLLATHQGWEERNDKSH